MAVNVHPQPCDRLRGRAGQNRSQYAPSRRAGTRVCATCASSAH